MGIIEQITQMKNQGVDDEQIVENLQEQGISPREIEDALNSAQIKSAIGEGEMPLESEAPTPQISGQEAQYSPEQYAPQNQEGYSPQSGYYSSAPDSYGTSTESTIEIAEQVFLEKIQKIQKSIDSISEFKALEEVKIENVETRLKRIESLIDSMQIEILEKVGAYGRGLASANKEMAMMQESFRKTIGRHRTPAEPKKRTSGKTSKKK